MCASDAGTLSIDPLTSLYDVDGTVDFIQRAEADRVALQFPDTMLECSIEVMDQLKCRLPDVSFFLLADTSFGSCCVDEVAAQHVCAQAIVHYGESCLSKTCRIPVHHVFGPCHPEIVANLALSLQRLRLKAPEARYFVIFYDLSMHSFLSLIEDEIRQANMDSGDSIFVCSQLSKEQDGQSVSWEILGRSFYIPNDDNLPAPEALKNAVFAYLGPPGAFLTTLMMTFNQTRTFTVDLRSHGEWMEQSSRVNRALMRRYYLVEKTKDCEIIGILVGTLGVDKYRETINKAKALISAAHKRFVVVLVGKVNDAKLANFTDIDIFVNIACPYASLLDTSTFVKDVITPFELDIALRPQAQWTGEYYTDFSHFLNSPEPDHTSESDEVRFSMISGRLVSQETSLESEARDLSKRRDDLGVILKQRMEEKSFSGLDPRYGKDEPACIEKGMSGIAREYQSNSSI